MKKAAVLAAALIMITTPALASPVDEYVLSHNMHRQAAGAAALPEEPEINGKRHKYKVSDFVDVIFIDNGDSVTFACVCLNDAGIGEFLAQCVTAVYSIGGLTEYAYCYGPILSDFLSARAGTNIGNDDSIPGLLFSISKQAYGYSFVLVKVK